MSKDKTVRLDQTFTSTRPDLEVNIQMPGAYIIKGGKVIPDLTDEAMMEREKHALSERRNQVEEKKITEEKQSDDESKS
ncbi:MAG: hypothetical protein WC879_03410 [Melioribacteraceae bacterium]